MDPLSGEILSAAKDAVIAPGHSRFLVASSNDSQFFRTAAPPNHPTILSLGDVREIARVRVNGRDLGVRFMPPYEFVIPPGVLKEKGNDLEVEVTNLGSNRLRWNDLNNVPWKCFSDINMVDINYKKLDASKWSVLRSGLLGPVDVR